MKLFKKDAHFYKKVFVLGFPIALQTLVTVFVGMLDNIMLSHYSQDTFSAASLANAYVMIFQIFCMGLGMGASVLVSRYYGMKKANDNVEKADISLKQTVCLMLRLMLFFATIFAIGAIAMPKLIMTSYTDKEELIGLGATYLRWSTLTFFFLGLSLVIAIVLRSVGQSRFPLYVSLGALVVNLAGNYLLIFGHFGAPKMGIAGAALATFLARVFEAFADLFYLLVIDKKIGFKIHHFFMKTKTLLKEYLRVCIPVLISDAILAFGSNAVTMVIGHLGGDFVAANSITTVAQQLSTVLIQGVCVSVQRPLPQLLKGALSELIHGGAQHRTVARQRPKRTGRGAGMALPRHGLRTGIPVGALHLLYEDTRHPLLRQRNDAGSCLDRLSAPECDQPDHHLPGHEQYHDQGCTPRWRRYKSTHVRRQYLPVGDGAPAGHAGRIHLPPAGLLDLLLPEVRSDRQDHLVRLAPQKPQMDQENIDRQQLTYKHYSSRKAPVPATKR